MKRLLALMMCLIVPTVYAAAFEPYGIDGETLHLYHFDGDGLDAVTASGAGINLMLNAGATVTESSISGFSSALNTYDGITGAGPWAGDNSTAYALSDLTGEDGSFTFEALVRPDLAAGSLLNHMEIICGEGNGANETRGFQFRINNNGTTLRFQDLSTGIKAYDAAISYTAGQWFHAAVTYDAKSQRLKMYWTPAGQNVICVYDEPALNNPILEGADTTFFCIGNELRGESTENFEGLIDEVRISSVARKAEEMMVIEAKAANPTPGDGAIGVSETTSLLSWNVSTEENVTQQYLYMVEDEPNFVGVSPVIVTDLEDPIEAAVPLTLAKDKVYYWRVDTSINDSSATDPNTIDGWIWKFETVKTIPVVSADPADVQVFPAETADFTAGLTSLSIPTVNWYKVGTPDMLVASKTGVGTTVSGDITVMITDEGSGVYFSTLSIAASELTDEGYYYCTVTNLSQVEDESDSASLIIKRLLAFYPFDGDANDGVGDIDGVLKGTDPNYLPGFVTGVADVGQAIELDGTQYVELPTDAYPHTGPEAGLEAGTISCWVRIDSFSQTAALLGTHNDGAGPACQMWLEGADGSNLNFRLRQNAGDTGMPHVRSTMSPNIIGDGKWHMITAAYEKGNVGQLYLDGVAFGTSDTYTDSPLFDSWQYPLLIGANNDRGTPKNFLSGAVDNLSVYNYMLDKYTIADLYHETYPETILCVESYASEYDFDNDCKVGLSDLVNLANRWLDCGRYPESSCNY